MRRDSIIYSTGIAKTSQSSQDVRRLIRPETQYNKPHYWDCTFPPADTVPAPGGCRLFNSSKARFTTSLAVPSHSLSTECPFYNVPGSTVAQFQYCRGL
eukprot:3689461-Rhodomonas_salina.2